MRDLETKTMLDVGVVHESTVGAGPNMAEQFIRDSLSFLPGISGGRSKAGGWSHPKSRSRVCVALCGTGS